MDADEIGGPRNRINFETLENKFFILLSISRGLPIWIFNEICGSTSGRMGLRNENFYRAVRHFVELTITRTARIRFLSLNLIIEFNVVYFFLTLVIYYI